MYSPYDMRKMALYLCGFPPPNSKSPSIHEKNRQIPTEKHFTKCFKTVKIIKNNESLRNCHSQEEPKET